jgi:hypothetical protein
MLGANRCRVVAPGGLRVARHLTYPFRGGGWYLLTPRSTDNYPSSSPCMFAQSLGFRIVPTWHNCISLRRCRGGAYGGSCDWWSNESAIAHSHAYSMGFRVAVACTKSPPAYRCCGCSCSSSTYWRPIAWSPAHAHGNTLGFRVASYKTERPVVRARRGAAHYAATRFRVYCRNGQWPHFILSVQGFRVAHSVLSPPRPEIGGVVFAYLLVDDQCW